MDIFNPMSISEFIHEAYIKTGETTLRDLEAAGLGKVMSSNDKIDTKTAELLSSTLGRSTKSWLNFNR